jgi:multiple sugar transport system permease protein
MTPRMKRLVSDTRLPGGSTALAVTAAATLVAFFWMLSTSFKSGGGLFTYPPTWIPNEPTIAVVCSTDQVKSTSFSILKTACCVRLHHGRCRFLSIPWPGYAFAKHRFRHRDKLFSLLLATMMVPGQLTMIPVFLLLKKMGLLNSYMGLIIPVSANVFGIF